MPYDCQTWTLDTEKSQNREEQKKDNYGEIQATNYTYRKKKEMTG